MVKKIVNSPSDLIGCPICGHEFGLDQLYGKIPITTYTLLVMKVNGKVEMKKILDEL